MFWISMDITLFSEFLINKEALCLLISQAVRFFSSPMVQLSSPSQTPYLLSGIWPLLGMAPVICLWYRFNLRKET